MNDDTKRLQEMLERATAPGDALPEDLDAETAALREGWLALSKLLTDAQSGTSEPWENWLVTPRPTRHWRPIRWALAVAASLLIVAGLAVAYRLQNGGDGVRPNSPAIARDAHTPATVAEPTPATVVEPTPATVAAPAAEARPDTQLAAGSDGFEWDDTLDAQITTLAQATALVHEDWYAQAGKLNALGQALDEVKKDIEDGTL